LYTFINISELAWVGIAGFSLLCPQTGILKQNRTQGFRNWICICPRMKGWEAPNLLDPLEKANLNHHMWTEIDQVSKTFSSLVFFFRIL
jgi:hypothetical protein